MTSYAGSGQPDDPQNRPEKADLPPMAGGHTTPPTDHRPPPPDPTLPPPPSYPPVPPRAPAKGGGVKIALIVGAVVLAVVLVCCLLGVVGFFAARPGDPAPGPNATAAPLISPRQVKPGTNAYDLHELNKGDCLVNDGTDQNASLREVPCGPNTYEVLAIIPFNSDTRKCWDSPLGDPKTEFTFVYDGATDVEDYVLCLKQR